MLAPLAFCLLLLGRLAWAQDFIPNGPVLFPLDEDQLSSADDGIGTGPGEGGGWPIQSTDIRMPGVVPQADESYLCTSFPLDSEEMHFIVGFKPLADMHKVHHVLLYGCEQPGSEERVWDCGEMSTSSGGRYSRSPICQGTPNILYAWAMGAPELSLPEGVGFRVGGGTPNQHLVLQVHYMHKLDQPDESGLRIASTIELQPKTAATLLLATDGHISSKTTGQMEVACVIDEPVELHPFAFRVHTHRHGQKVSGWLVEENESGVDKWTLLGQRDPNLPQLFQAVANQSLVIEQGDALAARCTIRNDEKREVKIGPTGEDEMCNFYLMYWVDGDRILEQNMCFSSGPPNYHWTNSGLNHIPK